MKNEYEIIQHNSMKNFKIFLVNLMYRTPHIHGDIEICFILKGTVDVTSQNKTLTVGANDYFVLNPYQSHELKSDSNALILSMQINPSFCKEYYPIIKNTMFEFCSGTINMDKEEASLFFSTAIELSYLYFMRSDGFEYLCNSLLNILFYHIIRKLPYHVISDKDRSSLSTRNSRIRRITEYIDEHYTEKLLLSDIGKLENLSITYLSHFFKDNFNMSFQEYLMIIRSEKARQLLILTNHNLLSISMDCGFSDIKYFNKAFLKQYQCLPKVYRAQINNLPIPSKKMSLLTTQELLSDQASIVILKDYCQDANSIFSEHAIIDFIK